MCLNYEIKASRKYLPMKRANHIFNSNLLIVYLINYCINKITTNIC